MPLEAVGFAPGAAGRWQQRRIPRYNESDTPSDLRFLKRQLWELSLELPDRGNRPWSAWDMPLEAVGFAPGAADRGIRSWSAWDLPLESSGRRICLWKPWDSPLELIRQEGRRSFRTVFTEEIFRKNAQFCPKRPRRRPHPPRTSNRGRPAPPPASRHHPRRSPLY